MRHIVLVLFIFLSQIQSHAQAVHDDLTTFLSRAKADPSDAVAWFNSGVIFQRKKDFSRALQSYQKVIQLGSPLTPVALYYQALIYSSNEFFGAEKETQAKNKLGQIKIENVPPNLKRKVLELKNKLFLSDFTNQNSIAENLTEHDEEKKEKKYSGFFDLSFGSNSNPQTLADLTTNQIASDQQTQMRLNLEYQFLGSKDFEVRGEYNYSGTFFRRATDSNYVYNDLLLPLSYYIDSTRLRLTPELYIDTYGGPSFSQTIGGTFDVTIKLDNAYLGISYLAQQIKNLTSTYSYLTGSQNKVSLNGVYSWSIHSISFVPYFARLSYQDTAALSSSYDAYGANLNYTYLVLPWIFSGSLGYESRSYPKADADAISRADQRIFEQFKVGYLLSSYFKINLEADNTVNQSNFITTSNDRAYAQTVYLLSLSLGI